ncbi:hypothetical protein [Bartonella gabonensis]|uniref:hypothetical protein n=1 Tax=Bartonella gabonensis TaxID=2699889 RepID=UPI00158974F2|nr:hypothetical protein [Bartonella gabonensis]
MILNEILSIAIFAMLLIDVVLLGFALYYRNQVKDLKERIEDEEFAARILKEEREEIREIISGYDENIAKCEEEIKELNQKIGEYEKTLKRKSETIQTLEAEVQYRDAEIEKLNLQNELNPDDGTEIQSLDEEIDLLKRKLDAYDETFGKNIKSMYELIAEIEYRDAEIEKLKDELKQRDEKIKKLKETHKEALQKKDIALNRRFKEVESLNKEIESLKDELKQRDASVKENSQKNKKKSK